MLRKSLLILVGFMAAAVLSAQNYSLFGTVDRNRAIYQAGEPILFTVKLLDGKQPVPGKKLHWQRTGDDKITQDGTAVSAADGTIQVKTTLKQPGFVRLYVTVLGDDGKPLTDAKHRPLFFDGGAGVAPETLRGLPEPADLDAYWQQQKAKLAAMPLKVLEKKELPGNDKVAVYDVKLACPGAMPVSGVLSMPKNAALKSLPAKVSFHGYGFSGSGPNLTEGAKIIFFDVNAHGILNGQPKEYYANLGQTTLKNYAFSDKENANRDTTYFNGMYLRLIRALEYVKSLPEWNGKDLEAYGGSQGGMQSLAAAGLDRDVTTCFAWSPWNCNLDRTKQGRLVGGWYIKYTPALSYYDPINLVKRANPTCKLYIIANLGDYVCPPSGVWTAYNNWPGPKTMEVRQGCEHGFAMPNYPKFLEKSGPTKKP